MKPKNYGKEWYDPNISFAIMQKYGDHSEELRDYLDNGKKPEL